MMLSLNLEFAFGLKTFFIKIYLGFLLFSTFNISIVSILNLSTSSIASQIFLSKTSQSYLKLLCIIILRHSF